MLIHTLTSLVMSLVLVLLVSFAPTLHEPHTVTCAGFTCFPMLDMHELSDAIDYLGVTNASHPVLVVARVLKHLRVGVVEVHLSLQLEGFFSQLGRDWLACMQCVQECEGDVRA